MTARDRAVAAAVQLQAEAALPWRVENAERLVDAILEAVRADLGFPPRRQLDSARNENQP